MILNTIIENLSKRLTLIEETHTHFSSLAEMRFTNEKLLQLETIKIISEFPCVVDYLPEKNYPYQSREKADIWFKTEEGVEHWVEVKMRSTNYHKKERHGKAITHGVNSIIRDIKRLQDLSLNSMRYVLFSFLPIFPDSYHIFNSRHLSRISEALGQRIEGPNISIQLQEGQYDLYLIQLNDEQIRV